MSVEKIHTSYGLDLAACEISEMLCWIKQQLQCVVRSKVRSNWAETSRGRIWYCFAENVLDVHLIMVLSLLILVCSWVITGNTPGGIMLFACFRTANKRAGMVWGFTGKRKERLVINVFENDTIYSMCSV
jgi:hypothetical protein